MLCYARFLKKCLNHKRKVFGWKYQNMLVTVEAINGQLSIMQMRLEELYIQKNYKLSTKNKLKIFV